MVRKAQLKYIILFTKTLNRPCTKLTAYIIFLPRSSMWVRVEEDLTSTQQQDLWEVRNQLRDVFLPIPAWTHLI